MSSQSSGPSSDVSSSVGAKTYSTWLKFFRKANIPAPFDSKYAVMFEENRIRMDMLMDLDKECLKDMGITAMGDIISILKHAKIVHEQCKELALDSDKPLQLLSSVNKGKSSVVQPQKVSQPVKSKPTEPSPSSLKKKLDVAASPVPVTNSQTTKKSLIKTSTAQSDSMVSSTEANWDKRQNAASNDHLKGIFKRTILISDKSKNEPNKEDTTSRRISLSKKSPHENPKKSETPLPQKSIVEHRSSISKRFEDSKFNDRKLDKEFQSERPRDVFSRLGDSDSQRRDRRKIREESQSLGPERQNSIFSRLGRKDDRSISPKDTSSVGRKRPRDAHYMGSAGGGGDFRQREFNRSRSRSRSPIDRRRSIAGFSGRLGTEETSIKLRLGSATPITSTRPDQVSSSHLRAAVSSLGRASYSSAPSSRATLVTSHTSKGSLKASEDIVLKKERVRSEKTGKFVIRKTILRKKS